jgi:hypothetical protein
MIKTVATLVSTLAAAAALTVAAPAAAQDARPFQFSITVPDDPRPGVAVHYDTGFGERPFDVTTDAGRLEHRIGIQASFGRRFTLLADAGLSVDERDARSSQRGEILYTVLDGSRHGLVVAGGGGIRHESAGVDVLLGRVAVSRPFAESILAGNLAIEHPVAAPGRDAVDVMTSVGWSRRISSAVHVGVEGIGEDLEGFWSAEEAEGGARLLVGPSIRVAPHRAKWQIAVTGGPVLHATTSPFSSDAVRELPAQTRRTGYAVRSSLTCVF